MTAAPVRTTRARRRLVCAIVLGLVAATVAGSALSAQSQSTGRLLRLAGRPDDGARHEAALRRLRGRRPDDDHLRRGQRPVATPGELQLCGRRHRPARPQGVAVLDAVAVEARGRTVRLGRAYQARRPRAERSARPSARSRRSAGRTSSARWSASRERCTSPADRPTARPSSSSRAMSALSPRRTSSSSASSIRSGRRRASSTSSRERRTPGSLSALG